MSLTVLACAFLSTQKQRGANFSVPFQHGLVDECFPHALPASSNVPAKKQTGSTALPTVLHDANASRVITSKQLFTLDC